MFRGMLILGSSLLLTVAMLAQQASGPASGKGPARGNAPAGLTVADVVKMLGVRISEPIIVAKVRQNDRPFQLSTDQMVQLKAAGASDNLLMAMLDPKSAAASVSTSPPAPANPAPAPEAAAPPPPPPPPAAQATSAPASQGKKRIAIANFEWAAVRSDWYHALGSEQEIGNGIRHLFTTRVAQGGQFTVVERADLQRLIDEQNRNQSARFKQGQGPRVGSLAGADAYLLGAITVFGQDDKTKSARLLAYVPHVGSDLTRLWGKESKAVVAIDYRLVDAETGDVLDAGEARGESSRTSRDFSSLVRIPGLTTLGGGAGVRSSDFQKTIIGEATVDCVEKLARMLNAGAAKLVTRAFELETRVAKVEGSLLTISAGADQGLRPGQQLTVEQNRGDVKDPVSGQSIGVDSRPIGTLTITTVRQQMASGTFSGSALPRINDIVRAQ